MGGAHKHRRLRGETITPLIKRIRNTDESALRELIARKKGKIKTVSRTVRVPKEHVIEELWRNIMEVNYSQPLQAGGVGHTIDRLRRGVNAQRRQRRVSVKTEKIYAEQRGIPEDPSTIAGKKEAIHKIKMGLFKFFSAAPKHSKNSRRNTDIFIRHYLIGETVSGIARSYKLPRTQVSEMLNRAIKGLRKSEEFKSLLKDAAGVE